MSADNTEQPPGASLGSRLCRLLGGTAVAAYVAITLFYFVLHLLGDPGGGLPGYFFRWDMFPDYATTAVRREAIGERNDGRFVRLVPGPALQFRQGSTPLPEIIPRRTRLDMPGDVSSGDGRNLFRTATERQLARYHAAQAADERLADRQLVRVYLIENYWPARMNLSEAGWTSAYGTPHPHRRYWRVIEEARIDADGVPQWKPIAP